MIQFNNNNRPVCNPVGAECELNTAALQDVWDALKCLSTQSVLTGAICFDFLKVVDQSVFFIDKDDVASIDSTCLIMFNWNGVQYYVNEVNNDDILRYVIEERVADFMITLVNADGDPFPVGSEDEPCDIRITVFKKENILDMINACEVTENCRD
ncbi:MAG TPA: hypothetical protein PK210_04945 [Bacteroidia bacterium]|nr:hypothetical protein [Bacteroidia bacterium]